MAELQSTVSTSLGKTDEPSKSNSLSKQEREALQVGIALVSGLVMNLQIASLLKYDNANNTVGAKSVPAPHLHLATHLSV